MIWCDNLHTSNKYLCEPMPTPFKLLHLALIKIGQIFIMSTSQKSKIAEKHINFLRYPYEITSFLQFLSYVKSENLPFAFVQFYIDIHIKC